MHPVACLFESHVAKSNNKRKIEKVCNRTLLYASWPLFTQSWEQNTFVGAIGDLTAPLKPVKLIICAGTALLMAQFAARIARL